MHDIDVNTLIRLHSEPLYLVQFIGFAPGFGYLSGLPRQLATPRLPSPRVRVPVGSVGIADEQTGIYATPGAGGWRLIGRTPLVMFDASVNHRPCFEPAIGCDSYRSAWPSLRHKCEAATSMPGKAALHVIEPGMLTTVQDLGRPGWTAVGVARGGAADTLSLRIGNRLVGNDDGDAALEMTLVGGTFACEHEVAGGAGGWRGPGAGRGPRTSAPVSAWVPFTLGPGERLVTGSIRSGVRSYLCVAGGILVPPLLGSRSTHLGGQFGGLAGRALRAGDRIDIGQASGRHGDNHAAARAGPSWSRGWHDAACERLTAPTGTVSIPPQWRAFGPRSSRCRCNPIVLVCGCRGESVPRVSAAACRAKA